MADVKPWEPIMGGWTTFDIWTWYDDAECEGLFDGSGDPLFVTLANGQRIIVRAKS